MMAKITKQQYDELQEAYEIDKEEFAEKLWEYTGITRKPYTAYNFYDCVGDYIGNSEDFDLDRLLESAYVGVSEDG